MGIKLSTLVRAARSLLAKVGGVKTSPPGDDSWRARYNEYMRSDAWRLVRSRVLARAEHRCEWVTRTGNRCKVTRGLQVHHTHYRNLGHEPPEDLVALCEKHHAMADRRRERETERRRATKGRR